MRPAREKCCARCGTRFTCGPERGQKQCWCDALPHIPPVAGKDTDCLCPTCLRGTIERLQRRVR
ncbi:MAG: cysteine-rich CWC family protein [Verrucomicrobia bacterium]|nr:cysteine-rich CWC family protein [Verrucomicrobiota bacterium]